MMVAEIANPERLGNGTIDFSFLVIYCLPLLLIVLTYDVGGFEKDEGLQRLIAAQYGSIKRWIAIRFAFYVTLLIVPMVLLIGTVPYINGVDDVLPECYKLMLLSIGYVASFSLIYGGILSIGKGSSENALNMIGVWVVLCILIPGAVHQYVSLQFPVSYMTDFLDANRKETYAVYSMPSDRLQQNLGKLYPTLQETHFTQSAEDNVQKIRQSLSALTNELNKSAAKSIEERNTLRNDLLRKSYWFNPVMFVQNTWNSYTSSDYDAYYQFRRGVQRQIDQKIDLLIVDSWNERVVEQSRFSRIY